MEKKVQDLWQNPAVGMTGVERFQRKLSNLGIHVDKDSLKKLLALNPSHALFTFDVRNKKWNTITETGVGHGMQMDLMDMSSIATRNKNFHWILCIIDVFSRYAWAFPLKRKSQDHVYHVLKAWLESLKIPPRRMTSDAGTEFYSQRIQTLLKSYHIEQYLNQAGDKTTTGIVERFNRTLRDLMGRNFVRVGKLHWVEDLPLLIKNYNQSYHGTLGTTPESVWQRRAQPKSRPVQRERFPFDKDDRVRVLLPTGVFDKKAGAQRWSTTIYSISRRQGFKYYLKNDQGKELKTRYRPSALKKVTVEEEKALSPEKPNQKSVTRQVQLAKQKQRTQRIFRKHNMPPPRLRRTGLRPTTRTLRLRPSTRQQRMQPRAKK